MRFKYEWSHAPIGGEVSQSALEVEFQDEAEAADWLYREAKATIPSEETDAEGTIRLAIPASFMRLTRIAE